MQVKTVEKERAASFGPADGKVDRPNSNCVSSGDRLEQAASVLLLLQGSLDAAEKRRLWRLFECRLRQAYAGVSA